MTAALLLMALSAGPPQAEKEVTAQEKTAFLRLLARLPTRREFFTEEAVKEAAPHTRVLLALTRKDIEKYDIYPFLALSRGLLDRTDQRELGVKRFGRIAHPTIKLCWGVVLFDEKRASPEIVAYLRRALASKEQAKLLAEMLGPEYDAFKKRVKGQQVKESGPAAR